METLQIISLQLNLIYYIKKCRLKIEQKQGLSLIRKVWLDGEKVLKKEPKIQRTIMIRLFIYGTKRQRNTSGYSAA